MANGGAGRLMCGIVGLFARDGPAPHRDLWGTLVDHLRHRGPDAGAFWGEGPFFLGHRRLAILGLESGHQPMATEDGGLVVSFNGEIYNFVELRAELEARGFRFRTSSDTEVLLHGYEAWGERLPEHLIGQFAFAIADRRRRHLFLARDRFGEKPLFVLRAPGYVAFASELRPLAALPDLDRQMDVAALGGYLSLNYVPGEATLLAGVRRLPPATWARFTADGEHVERYWAPPRVPAETPRSMEEALEQWRPSFDRAVRLSMRADVPVGILLSGGMDSALVAESAARQGRLNCAYFLDFEEKQWSERHAAEAVASRLGLPLESATLTSQSLEDFLQLVSHADDPLADSSALAVWTIARHAARKNKVVLGGDGGDELYGGYLTYGASRLHGRVIARLPAALRAGLAGLGRRLPTREGKVSLSQRAHRFLRAADLPTAEAHLTWNGTWLPGEAAALMRSETNGRLVRDALPAVVRRPGLGEGDIPVRALQLLDVGEYLPNDILAKVDRMSMAHGLEVRAPFLDHELATWALRLPERLAVGPRGELKALLRASARPLFGAAIADRPKQGFSIPIDAWTRGPLSEMARELLSPASVEQLGVLDSTRVASVLGDHLSGRRSRGYEIWGLAVLVAWHRLRIQRPPDPPRTIQAPVERTIPLAS
jgi:asparagine synthase (glutamine-hydrolysing)